MNKLIPFLFFLISLPTTIFAQGNCKETKTHGQGYSTSLEEVVDNCDGTFFIKLSVEHNGCSGKNCKDLSNYAIEAQPGTYSNVQVQNISGNMTYGNLDLGPNLGSQIPFSGFKIDGISGIGNGKAGVFTITYTLSGGLQNQRVSVKPGSNVLIQTFTLSEFEQVKNCGGNTCNNNSPTAPALNFNLFVKNDAQLVTNESEGPVAIGGDLFVKGNYQVSTNQPGNFMVNGKTVSLIVNNTIHFISGNALQVNSGGYVKIGNLNGGKVWYQDQNNAYPPIKITKNNNYNATPFIQLQVNAQQLGVSANNNPVVENNLIDFESAFTQLRNNSINLSACANQVNLTNPNEQPISNTNLPNQVKINLSPGKNVLNISGQDLNNVQVFTYNQKPNASRYLIINVDAPGTFYWNVWNQAGIGQADCPFILYNFYNTTKLHIIGNSTIEGTVLAPFADIEKTVNQANIEGQVIAKSFYQSGGELHVAVFNPQELGCLPTAIAPNASFQTNKNVDCFNQNSFLFTNNSTGTDTLNYLWKFGDGNTSTLTSPTHQFATSGIFTVKLIVSNNTGIDSTSKNVLVYPAVSANFWVNDSTQQITGNQFNFFPFQTQGINQHSWDFDDNNVSAQANPSHTFTQTGAYLVNHFVVDQNGCEANTRKYVYVIQDTTSSGNDGGVESKSLEGKLSALKFQALKENRKPFNLNQAPKFSPQALNQTEAASGTILLQDFIPMQTNEGALPVISSPNHLIGITNAEEVLSIDYALAGKNTASVLAAISKNEPYNHTKYTCDRFQQGEIISLQKINVQNMPFILFGMKRFNGQIEYGVELSLGKNIANGNFNLQSGWLINQYQHQDTMVNFQIWASNPTVTKYLLTEILSKANQKYPILNNQNFTFPKVYVTKIRRQQNKLLVYINNTTNQPVLDIKWCEKANEQTKFDTLYSQIVSKENSTSVLTFWIDDKYELDLYLTINDILYDKVYFADANWGLDFDNNYTSINKFQVLNSPNKNYNPNNFYLFRNVNLQANTEDYISIYKDLIAGHLPTNLTAYNGLEFFAKGKGKMLIRLSSSQINNWRAQYKTYINLPEDGALIQIPFSQFYSDSSSNPINLTALSNISFTYESQTFTTEEVNISLNDVAFVNQFQSISSTHNLTEFKSNFEIFPNPNNGNFSLFFDTENVTPLKLTIYNLLGEAIFVDNISPKIGQNVFNLNIKNSLQKINSGVYYLHLENQYFNKTQKIVLK